MPYSKIKQVFIMFRTTVIFAFHIIILSNCIAQKDSTDLEAVTIGESANIYSQLSSKIDLSVEQTLKYPGIFFDPARLAMAKAGVVNDNDQANGFAIRGNSPQSLQWRMEGAIILNPNHLSNASSYYNSWDASTGGVNMLSTQMLGTSSLIMGGFTSEYNNVLSGVMDMRLRNGRSDKRHYVVQIGLVGTDLSTEGALTKNKRWTYLANYRYSTVGLLNKFGVDFGGEKTAFQDLATTISYTNPKNWAAKVFFIAGKSHNYFTHDSTNNEILGFRKFTDLKFDQSNFIGGLTFNGKLDNDDEWKVTLAHSIFIPLNNRRTFPYRINDTLSIGSSFSNDTVFTKKLTSLFAQYNRNITKSLSFRLGTNINFTQHFYKFDKFRDSLKQYNLFSDINWQISPKARLVVGNLFDFSKPSFFYGNLKEDIKRGLFLPRVHFGYQINNKHSLNLAFNRLGYSYLNITDYVRVFSNLYNAKYQIKSEKWQAYVEFFYQKDNNYINTFFLWDYYIDKNIQENKGFTLGFYKSMKSTFIDANILVLNSTTKLVYRDVFSNINDGITLKGIGPYNNGFAMNFTTGKEWNFKKQRSIGINAHIIYNGGMPTNPPNTNNNSLQPIHPSHLIITSKYRLPNYFRLDTRVYLSKEHKRSKSTLSIDIQNVTNNKVLTGENFDFIFGAYIPRYQVGMVPILNYRHEW